MAKIKRIKPKKSGYVRTIPSSAKPVRFFIFLSVAVFLFLILFFFAVIRGTR